MDFYFKDKRKRDLDNCLKPLLDILKNRVIEDDSQVEKITTRKLSSDNNRIDIVIQPVTSNSDTDKNLGSAEQAVQPKITNDQGAS